MQHGGPCSRRCPSARPAAAASCSAAAPRSCAACCCPPLPRPRATLTSLLRKPTYVVCERSSVCLPSMCAPPPPPPSTALPVHPLASIAAPAPLLSPLLVPMYPMPIGPHATCHCIPSSRHFDHCHLLNLCQPCMQATQTKAGALDGGGCVVPIPGGRWALRRQQEEAEASPPTLSNCSNLLTLLARTEPPPLRSAPSAATQPCAR